MLWIEFLYLSGWTYSFIVVLVYNTECINWHPVCCGECIFVVTSTTACILSHNYFLMSFTCLPQLTLLDSLRRTVTYRCEKVWMKEEGKQRYFEKKIIRRQGKEIQFACGSSDLIFMNESIPYRLACVRRLHDLSMHQSCSSLQKRE